MSRHKTSKFVYIFVEVSRHKTSTFVHIFVIFVLSIFSIMV